MSSYKLSRFTKPEFLRQVAPELLLAFLQRFPDFMSETTSEGTIDYERLALLLALPGSEINSRLFDALTLIDEISVARNFDMLQEVVNDKPYAARFSENASVADLALLLWLNEPKILEQLHRRINQVRGRTLVYFQGEITHKMAFPTGRLLRQLVRLLNRVFLRKQRGRTIKITMRREPDGVWFMVRKGEPLTRDSSITSEGKTESVCYRPERFDLAKLRSEIAEIRLTIHRKNPWLIETYRTLFGYVFYGCRNYFSGTNVFTLEPLLKHGEASLACRDIPQMDEVTLVQCKFKSDTGEIIAIHGEQSIRILQDTRLACLRQGRLISAKFRVRFFDSPMEQTVRIKTGNQIEFKFGDDGELIEQWLTQRGFKHERK